jgi:tetratricopeptide (TPR) repeat protein
MFRFLSAAVVFALLRGILGQASAVQISTTTSGSGSSALARQGVNLAKSGRCKEALPLLQKSLHAEDKELRRQAGLAGVRCAMTLNQFDTVLDFLRVLGRDFRHDPEALYVAIHAYSDLATRESQALAQAAPQSPQAHELNAEALEMQGKWEQAEKEYRWILRQDPRAPGIHFRIGRLLLSKPDPGTSAADEAKKEFLQELEIDPSNAGAEYVLGELAREAQQWDDAVAHFSRASTLDAAFGDAFFGLGESLASAKKYSDAIPPLQTAVRLEPQNAAAHYSLAIAYSRAGRKQDAEKEFAIHRQMTQGTGGATEDATPGMPAQQNPN